MNKLFLTTLFIILSFPVISMGNYDSFDSMVTSLLKESVPIMKAETLYNLLQTNTTLTILDTRELKEFKVSHIKDAKFAGYKSFSIDAVKDIPKDSLIIIYCSVGYRSERIGELLGKAGFQNVYNLYGGIFDWYNKGFPVYNEVSITDTIHGYSKSWGKWISTGNVVY
ncbi:MAG: rhodanese-like domain-containing protein [Spirochaetales bacterium]|nr:rhodanese-like domain-containing protein [Spirochaetales bacterium]